METLTASVIIIVVFMIASSSFNNVFLNSVRSDDQLLLNRLEELKYLAKNEKISFPFYEEGSYWEISAEKKERRQVFQILNKRNGKNVEFQVGED